MSDQALIGDFGAPPDLPGMSDQSENGLAAYRLRSAGPSDLPETLDHSKSGLNHIEPLIARDKRRLRRSVDLPGTLNPGGISSPNINGAFSSLSSLTFSPPHC